MYEGVMAVCSHDGEVPVSPGHHGTPGATSPLCPPSHRREGRNGPSMPCSGPPSRRHGGTATWSSRCTTSRSGPVGRPVECCRRVRMPKISRPQPTRGIELQCWQGNHDSLGHIFLPTYWILSYLNTSFLNHYFRIGRRKMAPEERKPNLGFGLQALQSWGPTVKWLKCWGPVVLGPIVRWALDTTPSSAI